MSYDPNHPKISAYVLGELDAPELAEFEAALSASAELRDAVEQTRQTVDQLAGELQAEPPVAMSAERDQAVQCEIDRRHELADSSTPPLATRRTTLRRMAPVLAIAGSLVLLCGGTALGWRQTRDTGRRVLVVPIGSSKSPMALQRLPTPSYVDSMAPFFAVSTDTPLTNADFASCHRGGSTAARIRYGHRRNVCTSTNARVFRYLAKLCARNIPPSRPDHGVGPGMGGDKYLPIVENPFREVKQEPLSTFSIDVDTASYANVRRCSCSEQAAAAAGRGADRGDDQLLPLRLRRRRSGDQPFAVARGGGRLPLERRAPLGRASASRAARSSRDKRPGQQPGVPARRVRLDGPAEQAAAGQDGHEAAGRATGRERPRGDRGLRRRAPGWCCRPPPAISKHVDPRRARPPAAPAARPTAAQGIQLAYQTAQENFIRGGVNRVILCTDGDFNVGVTSTGRTGPARRGEGQGRRVPDRARLRHGQLQGLDAREARRQGQRQLRLHRHACRGPQGAGRADDRHAGHHRQGREDPGRVQPAAGGRLPPDRLREPPAARPRTSTTTRRTPARSAPATR